MSSVNKYCSWESVVNSILLKLTRWHWTPLILAVKLSGQKYNAAMISSSQLNPKYACIIMARRGSVKCTSCCHVKLPMKYAAMSKRNAIFRSKNKKKHQQSISFKSFKNSNLQPQKRYNCITEKSEELEVQYSLLVPGKNAPGTVTFEIPCQRLEAKIVMLSVIL